MKSSRKFKVSLLVCTVACMGTWNLQGAVRTWDSGSTGDNDWFSAPNWDGPDSIPSSSDTANFDGTATGGTAGDFASVTGFSNVDSSATVQKLTFGGTGAGSSTTHNLTISSGQTLTVNGDANGSLDQADFTVGMDLSGAFTTPDNNVNVTITGTGGKLQVGAVATHTADVVISRRFASTGNVNTTLNMSGLSTFEANVDAFSVGIAGSTSSAANFAVTLAGSNTINANLIDIANSDNAGAGNSNTFKLGTTNVFNADNIFIGHRKTGLTANFNTGLTNPTLSINNTAGSGAANLFIGYNDVNTGTTPVSTFDTSAGTLTASLNQVIISRHGSAGGSGNSTATFKMGAGSVTAGSVILAQTSGSSSPTSTKGTLQMVGNGSTFNVTGDVTDGGGSSELFVDQGAMTIGGNLSVDTLRVGYNGTANGNSGSLTVTGSTVSVGTGSQTLDIGRRDVNLGTGTSEAFDAVLDLSAVTTFTANVNQFRVGTNSDSGGGQRRPSATVSLAANSTVTANSMTIGYSQFVGGTNVAMHLGASTTFNVDTIDLGGSKYTSVMDFLAGGSTVTINGKAGAGNRANMFIGWQDTVTGGGASGNFKGAGSNINAFLNNLTIGEKPNSATGTTQGTMTFAAGLIDVNTLTLGKRDDAGSSGIIKGTFNFTGGTLKAGVITRGNGNGNNASDVAAFNWTGGTLHADTFGSVALPFNLVQNGGILAPGNSPGMTAVFGEYHLNNANSATYEVEINGYDQGDQTLADDIGYDFVSISDIAVLDSIVKAVLTDGFNPVLGDQFDVLTATSVTIGSNYSLDTSMAQLTPGLSWQWGVISGGNGEILRLVVVPLPTAGPMGLALLGAVSAMRRRSRR
ncbi:MAG: hypothetical protein GC162_11805 [Planctomycetes bacterium]|nr:hypothetical protein [Planctomycetota bacterium]